MPTNPNPSARKNIKPGLSVPAGLQPELEKFLQGIKEHLQGADGSKGQPKERYVTLRDLEEIGLINTGVKNGRGVITKLNAVSGDDPASASSGATRLRDLTDVDANAAQDDYILQYNAISGTWEAIPLNATIDASTSTEDGLAPASGGGTDNFLRADGSWAEPPSGVVNPLVYVNTGVPAGNTVENEDSETAFVSEYEIPADDLVVGRTMRLRLSGVFGTDAVAPTLRIRVKLGAITVLDSTARTLDDTLSDNGWSLDALMIQHEDGATGEIEVQGHLHLDGSVPLMNTDTITIDTTTEQLLTVTVLWGDADADNTITLRQMAVWLETFEQPIPELDSIDPDEVEET